MSLIYHPLPQEAIRLLTVHPRQSDGLIHCSFGVHSLHDEAATPSYIALSYVWGPDTPTFEIIVDDQRVTIRENLYEFLLQCSYGSLLWIDALCINQEVNHERSQQVQLMGSIYKKARVVWVWLGPARDPKLKGSLIDLRDNSSEYFDRIERYRKCQGELCRFDELDTLSQCEYWTRAWIVQEFLLAKQALLIYGDVRIDSELIGSLIYYQERNRKLLARKYLWESEGRQRDLFDPDSDEDSDLFGSGLANHESLMHSLCTQRDNYLPQPDVSEEPSIIWLLRNNYKRACREPRDIIYCLLSLAFLDHDDQKENGIRVDYDEDIASVFCSVMNGVELENDAIFAYATMLKRILGIQTELPIRVENIGSHEEKYIRVRGFIDGEVVEVLRFDEMTENEQYRGNLGSLSPSRIAQLKEYDSPFSSKRKDLFEWKEEWLAGGQFRDDHWVDTSTQRKVTFISPGDVGGGSTKNMDFLHQLSILENLRPKQSNELLGLVRALNFRCFPPDKQNPSSLSEMDAIPSRAALVVMQFRTKISSKEEAGVETHHFKADYVLGLCCGDVSVGDKILKFPYSLPGVAFSIVGRPRRQLTGVMMYDCNHNFGGSRTIGDNDDFPSYKEMTSVYRPDYLYGRISLRMKAEEILQLTP